MKLESLDIALLVVMVGLALATVMTARVLRSAILLAFTSAVLAVLMYRLGAPLASVFELSVCAGLIPAIFIAAVGMTQRLAGDDLAERKRQMWRRFAPLPGIVILVGVLLALWQPTIPTRVPTVLDANVGLVLVPAAAEAKAASAPTTTQAVAEANGAATAPAVALAEANGAATAPAMAAAESRPAPGQWVKVIDPNFKDSDVRQVLWNQRHADLLGQVTVLLAGAFAVVVLVKELRHD
jgi:NADH:ubiquinone oxidoreductase subunit 6 (subunit J)